jgi:hypothetical protein
MPSHIAILLFLNIGTPELVIILAILSIPAYFASRAIWRAFQSSGRGYAMLWRILTFILCFFATLFVIGAVVAAGFDFGR